MTTTSSRRLLICDSPALEGEMADRPEGGRSDWARPASWQMEAGAPRGATPSVAFGDISPLKGGDEALHARIIG
ncbi:hypothetical protein CK216_25540 [Mesorhizobium sp. WSM3876]|nr:hypothetical protein CK216_25540 [Mesorhizobium sp. WSM3876]